MQLKGLHGLSLPSSCSLSVEIQAPAFVPSRYSGIVLLWYHVVLLITI